MARTTVKGPLAFTASNGTTIETYDSDFALIVGNTGYVGITANKLTFLFGDTSTQYVYRDGASTYSGDQFGIATIIGIGGSSTHYGIVVRCSADTGGSADFYRLRMVDGSPQNTIVEKIVNGSATELDNRTSVSWAESDTIEFEAVTNGGNCDLKVYKSGSLLYTITDSSSPLTGGKPGFNLRMGSAGISSIDDLSLGSITAASGGGPLTGGLTRSILTKGRLVA